MLSSIRPRKEAMRAELRRLLWGHARNLAFVYDEHAANRLLEVPYDFQDIMDPLTDDTEFQFEIDRYPIVGVMDELYEFGVNGVPMRHPLSAVIGCTEWAFSYAFVLDAAECRLSAETHNGDTFHPGICLTVLRLATARLILEGGERFVSEKADMEPALLTFGEVALLADMEERSVRNAANPKKEDCLQTVQIGGTNTYIKPEDAKAWLSGRRGFVPTQRVADSMVSLLAQPFEQTPREVLLGLRARHKFSIEVLVEKLASVNCETTIRRYSQLERSERLDQDILAGLARVYGFDEELFALRVMEADQKAQLDRTQRQLAELQQRSRS